MPDFDQELREQIEHHLAKGREDLASELVSREEVDIAYLLELCERGVLLDALGHRRGPRELLERMVALHRYPEAELSLGESLLEDAQTTAAALGVFLEDRADNAWLAAHLARADASDQAKQLVFERFVLAHGEAAGVYVKRLALAGDAASLRRLLTHGDIGEPLLMCLRDPDVRDCRVVDVLVDAADGYSSREIASAVEVRRRARLASSDDLAQELAEELLRSGEPLILWALAENMATPKPVLEALSKLSGVRGARALRKAAARTMRGQERS